MTSHVTQHVRFVSCLSNITVESLGFKLDQQEICDQFICEVAGFNEDTLAFVLFLLNFSKFDAKISLRLVTQHCGGLKNDISLSHSEVNSGNKSYEAYIGIIVKRCWSM